MPSIVTSIAGGIQGSSAVHNAANAQVNSLNEAIKLYNGALSEANPTLRDAADRAANTVNGAASTIGGNVTGVADQSAIGVTDAASAAATGSNNAATQANAYLDPYMSAGQTAAGNLNQAFNFQADPGYDFRMQEGAKALQRSAAARGTAMGGGAMKAMERYGQGFASNEYQNAYNRFSADRQANIATAGLGANASAQAGRNLTGAAEYGGSMNFAGANAAGGMRNNAAQYAGNLGMDAAHFGANADISATNNMATNIFQTAGLNANAITGIGNARAAEQVGAANQWNTMLSGIGNAGNKMVAAGFGGSDAGMGGSGGSGGGGGFSWQNMFKNGL